MDGTSSSDLRTALDVLIEDTRWTEQIPQLESAARAAARLALEPGGRTVCLLLTDDSAIRALNAQFRGQDKPTNVLSFPAAIGAPEGSLGDIALAFDIVAREAAEQDKPFLHHTQHLILHGVLHLLGYDHETDADAREMEAVETRLLAKLGIADPYRSE